MADVGTLLLTIQELAQALEDAKKWRERDQGNERTESFLFTEEKKISAARLESICQQAAQIDLLNNELASLKRQIPTEIDRTVTIRCAEIYKGNQDLKIKNDSLALRISVLENDVQYYKKAYEQKREELLDFKKDAVSGEEAAKLRMQGFAAMRLQKLETEHSVLANNYKLVCDQTEMRRQTLNNVRQTLKDLTDKI
jgi:hypothetical protein